jgi:hypothetical protein
MRAWLRRGHHGPVGALFWIVATVLGWRGVEPVATYFYVAAWYPALLVVDAATARKRGWSMLSDRPLALFCLWAWSTPFWLFFEVVNLRLENWYYVFAPADPLAGRLFLIASFSTVLPALFLVADLLDAYGWFENTRVRPLPLTIATRTWCFVAGVAMLVLVFALPTLAYPLAWGFLVLLLEPFNVQPRWNSLLRDLAFGQPGRLLRLVVAGLACGAYWEIMNVPARARWIYTIPFFDRTLGVEMPPLGFLGFAPFALEAYAFVRALEIQGLSVPWESGPGRARPLAPWFRLFAVPAVVTATALLGIRALERWTVDSRQSTTAELPTVTAREARILDQLGLADPRDLAVIDAASKPLNATDLAKVLFVEDERATDLITLAQLAEFRGLGAQRAALLFRVGIRSVADLAAADPDLLLDRLAALGPPSRTVRPQRVLGWIRAARKAIRDRVIGPDTSFRSEADAP